MLYVNRRAYDVQLEARLESERSQVITNYASALSPEGDSFILSFALQYLQSEKPWDLWHRHDASG